MDFSAKKILIIEDNPLMQEVMAYILVSSGYEVFTLSNGTEVFNNIRKIHPDLIILDVVLPGINGNDICQLIKLNRATRNLPVIMCSGEDDLEDAMHQKGAPDDILQKPFDLTSLIEKVEHQLAA